MIYIIAIDTLCQGLSVACYDSIDNRSTPSLFSTLAEAQAEIDDTNKHRAEMGLDGTDEFPLRVRIRNGEMTCYETGRVIYCD